MVADVSTWAAQIRHVETTTRWRIKTTEPVLRSSQVARGQQHSTSTRLTQLTTARAASQVAPTRVQPTMTRMPHSTSIRAQIGEGETWDTHPIMALAVWTLRARHMTRLPRCTIPPCAITTLWDARTLPRSTSSQRLLWKWSRHLASTPSRAVSSRWELSISTRSRRSTMRAASTSSEVARIQPQQRTSATPTSTMARANILSLDVPTLPP